MPIQDRMVYLVICRAKDGAEYVAERCTCDLSRQCTVQDIADGQVENVLQVLECNPVEGICNDVTDEIAKAVMTVWADGGEALTYSQYNFVETLVSTRAARSFLRVA